MSVTSTFEPFSRENVFYDLETWAGMFEAVVKDNPSAADTLALLLYKIIRILSVGEGGIETETVINTLKLGVEWIYPFSAAHKVSFKLYLYYLECVLTPQDFPEDLLRGAIERAEAKAREIEAVDEADQPPKYDWSIESIDTSEVEPYLKDFYLFEALFEKDFLDATKDIQSFNSLVRVRRVDVPTARAGVFHFRCEATQRLLDLSATFRTLARNNDISPSV